MAESEKCQRCGKEGEDRRTLWMSCLCAMGELPMPLDEVAIWGSMMVDADELSTLPGRLKGFKPDNDAKPDMRRFYLLRVCKQCRGEWMEAISEWFKISVITVEDISRAMNEDGPPNVHKLQHGPSVTEAIRQASIQDTRCQRMICPCCKYFGLCQESVRMTVTKAEDCPILKDEGDKQ